MAVRRRRMRMLAVASVVMLLLVGMTGPAQAADPVTVEEGTSAADTTPVVPPGGHFAPYDQWTVSPAWTSEVITAGGCQYAQGIDNPHISETRDAVSIHGWWEYVGGTCPSKARVQVFLQAYACYSFVCDWVTLTVGQGEFYSGPGSGRWANARWICSNQVQFVGWRGFVDVDLIDRPDPPGVFFSPIINLRCYP